MSRLRNIPGAREHVEKSIYCLHTKDDIKVFKEDKELHIEIGMGKGKFITELARRNPEIRYIGIERYDSVLLRGIEKMEEMEKEGTVPKNLRFMSVDAGILPEFFEEGQIDKIYLNFSDPWPKDRHAKRRLESKEFLTVYRSFLKDNGIIEFKTDNRGLFDFALTQVELAGYEMLGKTFDLHNDAAMNAGNIMTEYEEKFSAKGNPINKYIIRKGGMSND